jgi:hypothetical protein
MVTNPDPGLEAQTLSDPEHTAVKGCVRLWSLKSVLEV